MKRREDKTEKNHLEKNVRNLIATPSITLFLRNEHFLRSQWRNNVNKWLAKILDIFGIAFLQISKGGGETCIRWVPKVWQSI